MAFEDEEVVKAMLEPEEIEVKVRVPRFILKALPEGKNKRKAVEAWINAILKEEGKNILHIMKTTPRETLETLERITNLQKKKERKAN